MNFINENMKSIIKKGIDDLYNNLQDIDKKILYFYVEKIIQFLSYQYNFNKSDSSDYEYEFIQNNYKDIKWLSTLLLPFLNVSQSELKSFSDMYTKKYNQSCDINKEEPKYIFTNIQFNRCIRKIENNETKYIEMKYAQSHLEQNFILLLKSLLICSNKLYVNWINILPYSLEDFYSSPLFLNTQELFNAKKLNDIDLTSFMNSDIDLVDENMQKLIGSLYIGDIYNTIRVYLYEEIKNIKLLIFDLVIEPMNQLHPALLILNEFFCEENNFILKEALNDVLWENLTESYQNIFTKKIKKLFEAYLKKTHLTVINPSPSNVSLQSYDVAMGSIQRLVKGILINFDNKYRNRQNVKDSGYISIKTNLSEEERELIDEDNIDAYNFENIEQSIESIKPEFMFMLFKDILQEFKTTFYSKALLTENKQDFIEPHQSEIKFTLKNLYNFAKSLSHYQKDTAYIPFNLNWNSLTISEKKIILDRLNDKIKDSQSWFNIRRYIKSLVDIRFQFPNDMTIDEYNRFLYREIRKDLISNIFQILITKGVLSRFVVNTRLTDRNLIGNKRITDYVAENLKYSLLTQSETNIYYKSAFYYLTDLPYEFSPEYFEELSKSSWTSMDPMEWISQIGFCHHFINNRVSYVSGATGVGKSTHVPKLFLYNIKALDYKSIGKVVCTQPRKTPTEKNAEQVSKQMGLPIIKTSKDIKEYSTNYYVQMQHKDKKHTKHNKHLVLKFITDGSLVEEFSNSLPIFKKQINMADRISVTPENIYDVIIIDEAHEHNKNMDILLTMMKLFTYYNPSIRLVILSATLDEDEPTYRRFYRAISDNMKFPYDLSLKQLNLDRINIDRRYHISPPGAGTRFTVNEYYEEKTPIVDLINRLIKTKKGDILVFQPGEGDINKLLEELNKTIDSSWIALPFFSSMNDDKKDFIQDIDTTFTRLRMSRDQNFNDCKNIYEGNNVYTNFVLIATNIAEASITINRLFYVIDTGTRKINYYDYKRRNNKLLTQFISETSRVQRKGRVGRTGPGDAYFMYKFGTTTDNKTPYEISIGNTGDTLYNKTRDSTDEEPFKLDNHINLLKNYYYTNDGRYDYAGLEHKPEFEYVPTYYKTGYNISDIIDNQGKFYIIHPDELNIRRNIGGKIVDIKTSDIEFINKIDGIIRSKKIDSFIEDYITTNFMYGNYNKTEEGKNINEMCIKLAFTSNINALALIYGLLLTSDIDSVPYNNLLIGAVALDVLGGDVKGLCLKNELDDVIIDRIINKNAHSDIEIIIENINKVLNHIKGFNLFDTEKNILDGEIKIDNIQNMSNKNLLNLYTERKDYEDVDIDRDIIINKISDNIYYKLIKNEKLHKVIENICYELELDVDMMIKIIRQYAKTKENIKNLFYPDKRNNNYTEFINKYRKLYIGQNYNHYDLIKLSYLLSQPYNICRNIIQTNGYLPLYNPSPEYIMNLGTMKVFDKKKKKRYILSTFIGDRFLRGYCYFISYNADRESIMCVFNFNIDIINRLKLFRNIYNKDRLTEIITRYGFKIKKFIDKLSEEQKLKLKLSQDYDKIVKSSKTFDEIIMDIKI